MKKMKDHFKTCTVYVIAFVMLISLMALPDDVYGLNNVKMTVSIKTFNGKYLCAENGGGSELTANRNKVGEWEIFQMVDLGKGYIALKGCNGDYVSVSKDGKNVYVDSDEIGQREIFQLINLDNNKIAFKTYNKNYMCAEDGGGGKVVADRKKIGDWETFELIETGDDQIDFEGLEYIALLAANGKYLCAEDGGGNAVVANRDQIGSWETFEIIKVDRNTVVLKTSNGKYLYLQDEEDGNINAKATKISDRAKFVFSDLGNDRVALKASNGKYVTVEDEDEIAANSKEVNKWSTFKIIKVQEAHSDKCNLTAIPGDKSVSFTWTKPNNTKNIIGYNLYRGTASGRESSTPITDFPIEGTSYMDKNLESGTTYYYVLRAVYKDKTLGTTSNEVAVSLKSRITLSAKAGENGVNLSWNKPSDASSIVGYNLYRGTASGRESSTPIADFPIEGTSYTDKNVENNATYYYILKAVYKDKTLGAASNEVSVKSGSNNKTIVLEVGSKYMFVSGQRKEIDPGKGTTMTIKNGRTFLPIRAVIESMGGEVAWDASDKRVSIYLKNNKIYLWIGSKTAKVNGASKESDVAPYISESGRTMLPLRFIVENLGCEADWDGTTKKVTIKINR
ncbi:hypothetical protein HNQ80_000586 [Anaerosolibacter carboniphilus]|uniref:Fibronectin type-III domain-containing protein n=1 Tax=Anaerosolibacter carboniphilus TaxID=1417629 RepID=A0A841KM48_9FIRM|nr:stalk domain-containing protein [Anaerosolibacter carboniphilus]MBB6214506.1 hypothetical protein [Anaerosolibacter carboniphilus]